MDDEFLHESKEEDQFIKEFDDSLSLGNQSLELVSDNLLEGNNILISRFFFLEEEEQMVGGPLPTRRSQPPTLPPAPTNLTKMGAG